MKLRLSSPLLAVAISALAALAPCIAEERKPPERIEIEFEGIAIEFSNDEADVVEILKPALLSFRIARRARIDAEVKAAVDIYENPENRKRVRERLKILFGREELSEDFDRHYDETIEELRAIAGLWKQWSGDVSRVRLWTRNEAKPFLKNKGYAFGQLNFANDGDRIYFNAPVMRRGYGFDAFPSPDVEIAPLIIDLPIFYKPGASADEIFRYPTKVLQKLPDLLVDVVLKESLRRSAMWTIERVAQRELEALIFAKDDRTDLIVAGLAAYYTLINEIKSGDQKRAQYAVNATFAFAGPRAVGQAETLTALREFVPLSTISEGTPLSKTAGRENRGLMARAFLELTRIDDKKIGTPVLQLLYEKGITIPDDGFDSAGFLAAVDTAVGKTDALATTMSGLQKVVLASLEMKLAEESSAPDKADDLPSPETSPGPAPPPPPDRTTSTFGYYQITHPDVLTTLVDEVGQDLTDNLSATRKLATDAFASQKSMSVDVSKEDATSLGRYGLVADFDTLKQWAIGSSSLMNTEAPMMQMLNSTQIQIWLKEDILAYLKSGGKVDGFSINSSGDNVSYDLTFKSNISLEDIETPEQVSEGFASDSAFVWPIILDTPPDKVTAQTIRDEASVLFGDKAKQKQGALDPEKLRLLDKEQVFFVAVHETVEFQLIRDVIASADRRWFCDGMANWIAIQECERRYGKGSGMKIFESMYSPVTYDPQASHVNLLAWPALENAKPGATHEHAHYYFATRALLAACDGRDDDFVKLWLEEIRKSPWNRTNTNHVIEAYNKLTGDDLRETINSVTAR